MKKMNLSFMLLGLFMPMVVSAANGVWLGITDSAWVNNANWSASPYPSGAERATFNNAGNGNTTLDLAGLDSLLHIDFSTGAGAYTIGSGAVNSQTLKLRNGASFRFLPLRPTASSSMRRLTWGLKPQGMRRHTS